MQATDIKITLALTNFNRTDLVLRAFEKVINDERVFDILIVDDCSDESKYRDLNNLLAYKSQKIFLLRNENNIGMQANKAKAISYAATEWVILLDSDNIIDISYIDALYKEKWDKNTIYAPEFAKPHFNYKEYAGYTMNRSNVKKFARRKMFEVLCNTCNYFVHRDTYLDVYKFNPEMKGTDTAWFLYLWLKAGKQFKIVPGMEYYHQVWDESEFLKDSTYNMNKSAELNKMIVNL